MRRQTNSIRFGVAILVSAIAGCAPSLDQLKMRDADVRVPDGFAVAPPAPPPNLVAPGTNVATVAAPGSKPPVVAAPANLNVKDFFKDDALTKLITSALGKNQELAILEQEINVTKNEIMAREGEYLPKLGLKGSTGIERLGKFTSQGASDAANNVPEKLPNYNFGLFATWELDVWKKLRNATQSALFRYLATVDGRNFMVTRLVAELGYAYYDLRALYKKVDILEQNIRIQTQALEIMRLEKQAARVTELAVKRFEAEVLKNQSRQYLLRQSIIEKENELNFLVGRFPQPIEWDQSDFISLAARDIRAGIPSRLLEDRPDVKQAEFDLKAAKLDVDVARARFYPAFSLEAGAGYQSFNTNHIFATPDSLFYNLAANLTAPLLNRKAIKAEYFSAGSKQLQAVYHYERTILKAYTEVTNQLNKVENMKNTFQLKVQQVDALNTSVAISNTLFRAARCDYMEVLLTRRDALEAQMELVDVKQEQMSAYVHLYQALGGGWKQD